MRKINNTVEIIYEKNFPTIFDKTRKKQFEQINMVVYFFTLLLLLNNLYSKNNDT